MYSNIHYLVLKIKKLIHNIYTIISNALYISLHGNFDEMKKKRLKQI